MTTPFAPRYEKTIQYLMDRIDASGTALEASQWGDALRNVIIAAATPLRRVERCDYPPPEDRPCQDLPVATSKTDSAMVVPQSDAQATTD